MQWGEGSLHASSNPARLQIRKMKANQDSSDKEQEFVVGMLGTETTRDAGSKGREKQAACRDLLAVCICSAWGEISAGRSLASDQHKITV